METEAIGKELLEAIDNSDDDLLEKIQEVIKEHNEIPEEQMKLIMKERENYLNGKEKSYSWEEAKEIVRSRKKVYDFYHRTKTACLDGICRKFMIITIH